MDPKAFFKLSYGMYVVCSKDGDKVNGQVANTVFQISSEPLTLAVSINRNNLTHELISKSKTLSVSVLRLDTPLDFIARLGFRSGRDADKLADVKYKLGDLGLPVSMENTAAYFEAEVIDSTDVATHTLFIGRVVSSEVVSDGPPMTYADYHAIKSGQKQVSVTVEKSARENEDSGDKYECVVCGYIYDPAVGDPDSGIAPGTAFEDIPDDWVCPLCGVGKDEFEKVNG